jgi:hypothetical protein
MDSIGLVAEFGIRESLFELVGKSAFTGKRRVIDRPFSGLVTGLPKAPPEIAQ